LGGTLVLIGLRARLRSPSSTTRPIHNTYCRFRTIAMQPVARERSKCKFINKKSVSRARSRGSSTRAGTSPGRAVQLYRAKPLPKHHMYLYNQVESADDLAPPSVLYEFGRWTYTCRRRTPKGYLRHSYGIPMASSHRAEIRPHFDHCSVIYIYLVGISLALELRTVDLP